MPASQLAQASRIVPASAEAIFDLLATPAMHPLIDGSGTVKGVQGRTPLRLSAGSKFGMEMHWLGPYKILNHVVEFDEGRRIAWRHWGGHVWRYLLEPLGPNATRVTEQFDPATSRWPFALRVIGSSRRNQRSIELTLQRLVSWASA